LLKRHQNQNPKELLPRNQLLNQLKKLQLRQMLPQLLILKLRRQLILLHLRVPLVMPPPLSLNKLPENCFLEKLTEKYKYERWLS